MASNGTITVADLDADLAELNKRAGNCRELIHRALLELASIDYRTEVLLERRYALSRITTATTASITPRCG